MKATSKLGTFLPQPQDLNSRSPIKKKEKKAGINISPKGGEANIKTATYGVAINYLFVYLCA